MTTTTEVKLYTPAEASTQGGGPLPFHPRTLVRFAREDKIGHVRLGARKIRFTDEHIAAFIAAGDTAPQTKASKPSRNPRYAKHS